MNKPYFIAETAFHHQGEMAFLVKLIDKAFEVGCHAVKFQIVTNLNNLVSTKHSSFEKLSKYTFDVDTWRRIIQYAKSKKLEVVVLPLDAEAVELAIELNVELLEIHSVSFNDLLLRKAIKDSGIDVMLGVGGRTIDEINEIYSQLGDQLVILMTGFQSFPSELIDVKIHRIAELKKRYQKLDVGYADHSDPKSEDAILSNVYASYLGAAIFEKHLTIELGTNRVDAASAVSPDQLKEIIRRVSFSFQVLKEDPFELSERELIYKNRQLVCVAARDLSSGQILGKDDIMLKMIDPKANLFFNIEELVGKKLVTEVEVDSAITYDQIQ